VLKVGADGLQSAARTSRGRGTAALRKPARQQSQVITQLKTT
jgi:hypothetical protein